MAIKRIPELKGYSIIELVGNGWAEANLAPKELGLTIHWVPKFSIIPAMLIRKRSEIAIMPLNVTKYTIRDIKLPSADELTHSANSLAENPFCLLIRKTSPYIHLITPFNKTLQEMRADGSYEGILKAAFQ